jgi:hypothetical protein
MDDRPRLGRDDAPTRNAPAPRTDDRSPDPRQGSERTDDDRSSPRKPALTDRERNERWPLG